MAEHVFTSEIQNIERQLNDVANSLEDLYREMSEYFGGSATSTEQCNKIIGHIEDAIDSLIWLDRRVPRNYTGESRDRTAPKLESRIKRLERLMKK